MRTIARRRFEPGPQSVVWNGLTQRGRRVLGGTYRVRVVARNEVGAVELEAQLRVRRVAGPKK